MSRPNFADPPKTNRHDYLGILYVFLFVMLVFGSGYLVSTLRHKDKPLPPLQKKLADEPVFYDKIGVVTETGGNSVSIEVTQGGIDEKLTLSRSRLIDPELFAKGDKVGVEWFRHQEDDGHMANYPLLTKITNK